MPPKPTVPMASANHTWGRRRADSSERRVAPPSGGQNGTQRHTASTVTRAITETAAYGHCHPYSCPRRVVTGTPTMLATVRPVIIIDTAQVRRWAGTREAATREP